MIANTTSVDALGARFFVLPPLCISPVDKMNSCLGHEKKVTELMKARKQDVI
jgi:hypothetical protein